MMYKYLMCVLVLCVSTGVLAQNAKPTEFQTGIQKTGVQVFDVRTASEFSSGHLPHAFQADFTNKEEFNERVKYLNKEEPVYVYCLSGGRSSEAAKWMRANGFANVVELEGGINAWKEAGLQVEGASTAPQFALADFAIAISEGSVLVDVGAEWCPPCKKMEPVVAAYLKAHKEVKLVKVDGGKDANLVKALGARSLPTFIFFKDGREEWRRNGVFTDM